MRSLRFLLSSLLVLLVLLHAATSAAKPEYTFTLTLKSPTVAAGGLGSFSITMNKPFDEADAEFTLVASDASKVAVPATVVVTKGTTVATGDFEALLAGGPITIKATQPPALGGYSETALVTVTGSSSSSSGGAGGGGSSGGDDGAPGDDDEGASDEAPPAADDDVDDDAPSAGSSSSSGAPTSAASPSSSDSDPSSFERSASAGSCSGAPGTTGPASPLLVALTTAIAAVIAGRRRARRAR